MLRIKLITIILFFVCCQNTQTERSVVSRVFDNYLYFDELPDLPESVDSLIFIQNYINQWATKKLLLNKAEFNLDKESKVIDSLVKLYQESLLIHYYKEAVIQNYLDTIISDSLVIPQLTKEYLSDMCCVVDASMVVMFNFISKVLTFDFYSGFDSFIEDLKDDQRFTNAHLNYCSKWMASYLDTS